MAVQQKMKGNIAEFTVTTQKYNKMSVLNGHYEGMSHLREEFWHCTLAPLPSLLAHV